MRECIPAGEEVHEEGRESVGRCVGGWAGGQAGGWSPVPSSCIICDGGQLALCGKVHSMISRVGKSPDHMEEPSQASWLSVLEEWTGLHPTPRHCLHIRCASLGKQNELMKGRAVDRSFVFQEFPKAACAMAEAQNKLAWGRRMKQIMQLDVVGEMHHALEVLLLASWKRFTKSHPCCQRENCSRAQGL